MVPFRLTQNLVDAFGVSGYEGAFRRACEVTLQVLYTGLDKYSTLEAFEPAGTPQAHFCLEAQMVAIECCFQWQQQLVHFVCSFSAVIFSVIPNIELT